MLPTKSPSARQQRARQPSAKADEPQIEEVKTGGGEDEDDIFGEEDVQPAAEAVSSMKIEEVVSSSGADLKQQAEDAQKAVAGNAQDLDELD